MRVLRIRIDFLLVAEILDYPTVSYRTLTECVKNGIFNFASLLCGSSQSDMMKSVEEFFPQIVKFRDEYVGDAPKVGKGKLDLTLPKGYRNEALSVTGDKQSRLSSNIVLSEVRQAGLGVRIKFEYPGSFWISKVWKFTIIHLQA